MGRELKCKARIAGKLCAGTALLETKELIFRGENPLRIPFAGAKFSATNGKLRVRYSGGEASFELGEAAADWLRRIQNPKSRIEKLGIKPGLLVSVIDVVDADFARELRAAEADVSLDEARSSSDLIFFGLSSAQDLKKLPALTKKLKPDGALWTLRLKGSKEVTESSVMAAGKAAGLVDIKVVSFSDAHTAEKFVIPVDKRVSRARKT
jgi:hypothetical protein